MSDLSTVARALSTSALVEGVVRGDKAMAEACAAELDRRIPVPPLGATEPGHHVHIHAAFEATLQKCVGQKISLYSGGNFYPGQLLRVEDSVATLRDEEWNCYYHVDIAAITLITRTEEPRDPAS